MEGATDPAVPKTMKGPAAPTESERTAYEMTHLPPAAWCETCISARGIESPHVRLSPLERDEKLVIAMDFAARKARADDGEAEDDLGDITGNRRFEHWMQASDSVRDIRSHRLPCRLSGRLREELVCRKARNPRTWRWWRKVKAKMPDTVVVKSTPRHSSASNGLAEQELGNLVMHGLDTLDCVSRECTWSGWHHTVQGSV